MFKSINFLVERIKEWELLSVFLFILIISIILNSLIFMCYLKYKHKMGIFIETDSPFYRRLGRGNQ